MLKLFRILVVINAIYQLKLFLIIKIHNIFTLNLLQLNSVDLLKKQQNESLNSIIVEDKDE